MNLEGLKGIADFIEQIWRVKVDKDAVWRLARLVEDPLPVKRKRRGRGVCADPDAVRAWAERNAPV